MSGTLTLAVMLGILAWVALPHAAREIRGLWWRARR